MQRSWRFLVVFAAIVLLAMGRPAAAQSLGIGDPAPKLTVQEFVKGTPVTQFKPGNVYVVEFWATWCGPCKVSIPHLTELAKTYKDVTFVGVSVWETDQSKVKPFVAEMGDKMNYRVALDVVPPGAKGSQGAMAQNWMTAAGENGIPSAFIVGRDSKIAWIGHPMAMDKPLKEVVAGTWNPQAAIAERTAAQAGQAKMATLQRKLAEARKSGDPAQTLAVLDAAVADDPAMEQALGALKFQTLAAQPSKQADALAYGNRLVDAVWKDNPGALNQMAWLLVDPDQPKRPNAATFATLAVKAARRADDLTGNKEPAILDTLAKAYYDSGDAAKALECQEKAVRLAQGTPSATDKDMLARLAMYRKAVRKP